MTLQGGRNPTIQGAAGTGFVQRFSVISFHQMAFRRRITEFKGAVMDECCCGIQVGQKVPDFTIKTFEAAKGAFGTFNLAKQMKVKKWTVLFFYPADFTFV